MCPSYRATREERFSTRGRARLLSEMLRGEVITDGWQSEEVREALDWCLGCKGCRSDCPTHTDMASYKAEFMSHHYEAKARPRQAFFMGRIGEWAPRAAKVARLANFFSGTPGLAGIAKRVAGIAPERPLPRFAPETFRARFEDSRSARRDPARDGGARRGDLVILLPDTFSNHFRPQTALAAADVLEAAGCRVDLPREPLCCGRPYYDFGLLEEAKASLQKIVSVLAPQIEAGLPLVVLEPGCLSVFRDELKKMLPDDPAAQKLSKLAVSLGELLSARGWQPPRVEGRALVHGHCHQKALGGMREDLSLLSHAGLQVDAPDMGCCGMAGSFGFRPETYEASLRIADLALMPKVRGLSRSSVVVANGFSCREQIEDLTGRETLHLAEVLAQGLERDKPRA